MSNISLDERVEKAVNYLATTDEPAARAKTLFKGLEAQIKTIEAVEFKKTSASCDSGRTSGMTVPEKWAEVHTSQSYLDHHKKIYDAMLDHELLLNRRNTAELLFEYWRSMNSNKRQGVK